MHGLPMPDPLPWLEITEVSPSATAPGPDWARMLLEATSRKAGIDTAILVTNPLHVVGLAARQSKGPLVVDFCDSLALYHWRRAKLLTSRDPLRAGMNVCHSLTAMRQEVAIGKRARLRVASSPVDAAFLQRFLPDHPIRVVANGSDWLRRDPPEEHACERTRLVFHGGFGWHPNEAALEYLALAQWPKIKSQVPDVEFHVFGHSMSKALRELCAREGIVAHGYVEDLFELVATSGLYLAPMVAGGGVKNKIMEAMAAGVPVVTNTMGAEALPSEAREVVAVRDDPQAFTDYVRDVLADPRRWSELRRRTRLAAERCFDWQHRRSEFANLLAEAVSASEADAPVATA